jgi:hypothetical protein
MNAKLREAQVLATTEADREEGNEGNPILYAEGGINRFQSMTLFFPEEDGVKVEEDLDLDIVSVYYFNEQGQEELTEGALYVKYQVTDKDGKVLDNHSTYSHSFNSIEEAQEWIEEEGDFFLASCNIDSKAIGGEYLADDLLIVRVNGFPVVKEEVLANV